MKVVFVTANLNSGGAERVISLLANEFDNRSYEVEIIYLRERITFYSINKNIKVIVADEECHSKAMWKKMLWLRRNVSKKKPGVVIPFRVSVYTTTLFSLLGLPVPVISSERIDPHIPDPIWDILRRLLLPFSSHLVVQTSYIKSYYPRFIQKKTSVILNPVDENVFKCCPERPCIEENNKANRIISVARLAPQKNQKMMIHAFAKIATLYPNWQLVIFGEGPLRKELEALIISLGLQDRIMLPGRTDHVIEELRKSKIFCLSSNYEGLSNSMIEAFCVGLPIVTTKVSGTEDFIDDGINGFLLPINDVDAMAKALDILMKDDSKIKAMGERNRSKASMFGMDRIFSQWENLLKTVVVDGN